MPSSGVSTYRTNRDQIIKGALRLVNAYDPENSAGPTTAQITNAAEALNLMIKAWEAHGLQLWERRWGVVFPKIGQGVYSLGTPGPGGDHATLASPLNFGDFVNTTLAANASGSTITVTSLTSNSSVGISAVTITNLYNIGIQLDGGDLQWTTVNGAPAGNVVTLTASLTGAASAGNRVYCYQTKLLRPLRILDGWVKQVAGGNDIPVNWIPREQYDRYGLKSTPGTPVQAYYDPQVSSGFIYIYPVFQTAAQLLFIEFQKPIDDFVASGDDFDLPQEWGSALKFNLAIEIAPEYEITDTKYKQIAHLADSTLDLVNNYDQENTSLFLQPNQIMIDSLNRG